MVKNEELMSEIKEFYEYYKPNFKETHSEKSLEIDVNELIGTSPNLHAALLAEPKEILNLLEIGIEGVFIDQNKKIRLKNFNNPKEIHKIRVRDLNHIFNIKGIIKRITKVIPRTEAIRYECPTCGAEIEVPQTARKKTSPGRCSCGRKGGFRIKKEGEDIKNIQELNLEEIQENLDGKQPQQLRVYLEEELTDGSLCTRLQPGRRVEVIGVIEKLPTFMTAKDEDINLSEFMLYANNIISLDAEDDLSITPEDEKKIKEIAKDNPLQKLADSLVPEIYGNNMIKKAIVLQIVKGVAKEKSDGTFSREDINILLCGDVGVSKSLRGDSKIFYRCKEERGYKILSELFEISKKKQVEVLTVDMEKHSIKWSKIKEIVKHLPDQELIKITTENGKELVGTKDHSFLSLNKSGGIQEIKGGELTLDSYVPLPKSFHHQQINSLSMGGYNYSKRAHKLKDINLNFNSGFFFGIFLAEGSVLIKHSFRISISSTNQKIKGYVKNFFKDIGITYSEDKNGVHSGSRYLSEFLHKNCYNKNLLPNIKKGIKGNYSAIKKLPEFIYFAPRGFIYGLISGLFSGDGHYRSHLDKKKINRFTSSIELTSISKELIQDTSDLLYSIGILNKISFKNYIYKGEVRKSYHLHILKSSLNKLLKKIKFLGRPQNVIKKAVIDYFNTLPVGDLLYSLSKKLGYNSRKIYGEKRTICAMMRNLRNKQERIGVNAVKRFLKQFYFENKEGCLKSEEYYLLHKIAYSDINWSKIKSIENIDGKKEFVYDIEIPETHTFVANGIGVHNSATLRATVARTPKSKMIVATKTSKTALGAMAVRDEITESWSLQAGILVLCSGGLVSIDELDKLYKEHLNDLLEPMSAGTVSINKAGISATLPAHTSILASANPIYGNYDLSQPLAKQIDLPSPILNRFDLIFIMIDRPNEDFDSKAVEHIFKSYKEKMVAEIPTDLFKKYIIYCKKLKPVLADNLVNYIQEFYINIREKSNRPDIKSIPVNLRNMEALVKLAEANSKLRLSSVVELEDLDVAKEIFLFCIKQIGIDEDSGAIDMSRTFEKMPLSKRAKMEKFLEMIYNLCQHSEEIYYSTIIEEGKRLGMKSWEVNIFLETLQKETKIYEPTKGVYKIVE